MFDQDVRSQSGEQMEEEHVSENVLDNSSSLEEAIDEGFKRVMEMLAEHNQRLLTIERRQAGTNDEAEADRGGDETPKKETKKKGKKGKGKCNDKKNDKKKRDEDPEDGDAGDKKKCKVLNFNTDLVNVEKITITSIFECVLNQFLVLAKSFVDAKALLVNCKIPTIVYVMLIILITSWTFEKCLHLIVKDTL
ncbi:unnamed protein product [Arabidopsis thaliana]|uniref:(thale cress) hypothetical protein n=1 Tax=Arabidopsis thaliana TaxID=3702 RepID=A0A7G2EVG8_ARATH|nr:unnamed protein product [Arabidopsis thaliana]